MRVAFFDDFKGADTILFSGMATDLRSLTDVLESLAQSNDPNFVVKVDSLPFATMHHGTLVELRLTAEERVVNRRDGSLNPNDFIVAQPREHWAEDAERVRNVANCPNSHNWICDVRPVTVMVSHGEFYGDAWWRRHG